jgi:ribosomal protein L20A (L18A)
MQNFIVKGVINKGAKKGFSLEISARSERHATALAKTMIGSRHGLKRIAFEIQEVKKK